MDKLHNCDFKDFINNISSNSENYILNNLSSYDKKTILISLLNDKLIEIIINFKINNEININYLIFSLLKCHYENFIIYPNTINIIHFILFNNLNINILLNILLIIYYYKNHKIEFNFKKLILKSNYQIYDEIINLQLNNLINELYNTININIININFDYNYNKLLLKFNYNNCDYKDYTLLESNFMKNEQINNDINFKNLSNKIEKLNDNYERLNNFKLSKLNYEIENHNKKLNETNKNIIILENMIKSNNYNFVEFKNKILLNESYNQKLNEKINILNEKINILKYTNYILVGITLLSLIFR